MHSDQGPDRRLLHSPQLDRAFQEPRSNWLQISVRDLSMSLTSFVQVKRNMKYIIQRAGQPGLLRSGSYLTRPANVQTGIRGSKQTHVFFSFLHNLRSARYFGVSRTCGVWICAANVATS